MKQKDIALLMVIIFISAVISFFVSKSIFVSPKDREQETEVVQAITADFSQPDKKYFNDQAINPTKLITIGQNTTSDPFRNTNN